MAAARRSSPSARTASRRCTRSSARAAGRVPRHPHAGTVRPRRRAADERPLPRRLHHRVRRARGRGVRVRGRRLRAEAGRSARLATTIASPEGAAATRAARPAAPADATGEAPAKGHLNWVQATVGNKLRLITVDEIVCFQADAKYTRVLTRDSRSADPEADQGTRGGARSRAVLANPPQHDRQYPLHRRRAAARRRRMDVALAGRGERFAVSQTYQHQFRQM